MKTFPNVRFITGSQALDLYPDLAQGRQFSATELSEIAKAVTSGVSFQQHGEYALSASEILDLLTSYVATATPKDRPVASVRLSLTPYGPSSAPPALEKPINVPLAQFLSTVLDVRDFLMINHQVPGVVWLGSTPVPPENYLLALAEVSTDLKGRTLPHTVTIAPAQLVVAEYIAKDSVKLWDWPIFPNGFHSARLMDFARLQAWTLKPAILTSRP
jgi:hypothetical protein